MMPQDRHFTPLDPDFFKQDTLAVARGLLGCLLVHSPAEPVPATMAGMIVETEAYCGPEDLCAHTARGRHSPRNKAMHGPPAHAYIYRIYGMHLCFNVVTGAVGIPHAVLIRAVHPVVGAETMRRRFDGPHRPDERLCRGPALLCKAMGITMDHYGANLLEPTGLYLAGPFPDQAPAGPIKTSPRINVTGGEPWVGLPWRFYFGGHPSVSGPPKLRQ